MSLIKKLEAFINEQTEETNLALALTGKINYINELLKCLENDDNKEIAALALHVLTGAGIMEEVFQFEPIDEDLLFDDEKKKLDEGNNPYPDRKEPGEKSECPLQREATFQSK